MYPLKSDFEKGDPITSVGAEWLNTVAKILNGLSIQGGTINKTVDGENWMIIPQIGEGYSTLELDFLKVTSLDGDGCPDASEWRTIGFLVVSDVASTIDD